MYGRLCLIPYSLRFLVSFMGQTAWEAKLGFVSSSIGEFRLGVKNRLQNTLAKSRLNVNLHLVDEGIHDN